jgi:hypothetical protein
VHPLQTLIPCTTGFSTVVEVLDRVSFNIGQLLPGLLIILTGVLGGRNELFVLGNVVPAGTIDRDMPSYEAVVDVAIEVRL